MNCPKCGSDKISFMVNVLCEFDYKRRWHKIIKEAFRETATKLIGVDWDKAQIYCQNCNYQFKRITQ
jgi:hypothetical protein